METYPGKGMILLQAFIEAIIAYQMKRLNDIHSLQDIIIHFMSKKQVCEPQSLKWEFT